LIGHRTGIINQIRAIPVGAWDCGAPGFAVCTELPGISCQFLTHYRRVSPLSDTEIANVVAQGRRMSV
jgi:hypothetical protein